MLQANLFVSWRCMPLFPAVGTSRGPLRGMNSDHASAPSSIVSLSPIEKSYCKKIFQLMTTWNGTFFRALLLHGRSMRREAGMWISAGTIQQCKKTHVNEPRGLLLRCSKIGSKIKIRASMHPPGEITGSPTDHFAVQDWPEAP